MREKSILMVFLVFCAAVLCGVAYYASGSSFSPMTGLAIFGGGSDEKHQETPEPDRSLNQFDPHQRPKNFKDLGRQDVSHFFDLSIPMDQPHMPDHYVVTWATLVISDVMTFDHLHYAEHMARADDYFTAEGWDSFKYLMERTRMLGTVKENQYKVVTVPSVGPQLEHTNVTQGVRYWNILLPVVMSYQGQRRKQDVRAFLSLEIVRSAQKRHPYGLAINSLLVTVKK